MAFTDWDLIGPMKWVGLANFSRLASDPDFWSSLCNSLLYLVFVVPSTLILSFSLALFVDRLTHGLGLMKTISYLPSVCPMVALALVWRWIYHPHFGLLNYILGILGLPAQTWLSSKTWALPAVAAIRVWRDAGYYMLAILAGLKGVPRHLYEAADLDGASWWQKLIHVTIPCVLPSLFFVAVTATIWALQTFDEIWMVTQGGPGNATRVFNYYLYQNAFHYLKMGYASAMAMILLFVSVIITLLQFRLLGRRIEYEL